MAWHWGGRAGWRGAPWQPSRRETSGREEKCTSRRPTRLRTAGRLTILAALPRPLRPPPTDTSRKRVQIDWRLLGGGTERGDSGTLTQVSERGVVDGDHLRQLQRRPADTHPSQMTNHGQPPPRLRWREVGRTQTNPDLDLDVHLHLDLEVDSPDPAQNQTGGGPDTATLTAADHSWRLPVWPFLAGVVAQGLIRCNSTGDLRSRQPHLARPRTPRGEDGLRPAAISCRTKSGTLCEPLTPPPAHTRTHSHMLPPTSVTQSGFDAGLPMASSGGGVVGETGRDEGTLASASLDLDSGA